MGQIIMVPGKGIKDKGLGFKFFRMGRYTPENGTTIRLADLDGSSTPTAVTTKAHGYQTYNTAQAKKSGQTALYTRGNS